MTSTPHPHHTPFLPHPTHRRPDLRCIQCVDSCHKVRRDIRSNAASRQACNLCQLRLYIRYRLAQGQDYSHLQ